MYAELSEMSLFSLPLIVLPACPITEFLEDCLSNVKSAAGSCGKGMPESEPTDGSHKNCLPKVDFPLATGPVIPMIFPEDTCILKSPSLIISVFLLSVLLHMLNICASVSKLLRIKLSFLR